MSTVAAIGTPHGKGGVSMIRITGENSHAVVSAVFAPANKKRFEKKLTGVTYYGRFFDKDSFFDDGIAVLYGEGHSYTGEQSAELYCHGGLLVTQRLLEAVFDAGAEPAGRGEFTKRAFINGKITLTKAEAVGGIIDAVSPKYLEVSANQASGSLSKKISEISKELVGIAASVYAYIDYPDEDMTDMTVEEMKQKLEKAESSLSSLIKTRNYGKAISDGINVSIVGKPNTGKSSLLNLLCREDRAIVTDIAGTTRDVITEKVSLDDMILNLSDTAGIREGGDGIEKIGMERSLRSLSDAELVLAVFDASKPMDKDDEAIVKSIKESGREDVTVCIMNKQDISECQFESPFCRYVEMSARTGEGLDRLTEEIKKLAGAFEIDKDSEIITNARQFYALSKAHDAVKDALSSLEGFTQDIAGMDIERAIEALDEADGRRVTEEIVNEIFSHFCVGK